MTISDDLLEWLMDSDPAIRYQTLRDLTGASVAEVAAERARIATEGWGARLLDLQGEDGLWEGGACFPGPAQRDATVPGQPWSSTFPVLQMLQEFGVDASAPRVERAIALVRDNCRWEHAGQRFFEGEVEPCINGRTVTLGVYFGAGLGIDVSPIVGRLLTEQLEDGGWNCEAENGSVRSSFATTINVLEGLLAYEQSLEAEKNGVATARSFTVDSGQLRAARRRGEDYLLRRHLFRRMSTGAVVDPEWLELAFPVRWRYDILRALDYFRSTGELAGWYGAGLEEAIEILRAKRQAGGRWLLERTHPGKTPFPLEEGDGQPSRWNTLRALRVLRWYGQEEAAALPDGTVL